MARNQNDGFMSTVIYQQKWFDGCERGVDVYIPCSSEHFRQCTLEKVYESIRGNPQPLPHQKVGGDRVSVPVEDCSSPLFPRTFQQEPTHGDRDILIRTFFPLRNDERQEYSTMLLLSRLLCFCFANLCLHIYFLPPFRSFRD